MRRCVIGLWLLVLCQVALAQAGHDIASKPERLKPTNTASHESGDVAELRFSDDSKWLAYSTVVERDQIWLCEVNSLRLGNERIKTLLPWKRTKNAAVYAAWAYQLEWRSPHRVLAAVADGDVGYTEFLLDPTRTGVLLEEYFAEETHEASPHVETLKLSLLKLYPEWNPEVLSDAMEQGIMVEGADVEVIAGLDDLVGFDLSPDLRHLAATQKQGETRRLTLYSVQAF